MVLFQVEGSSLPLLPTDYHRCGNGVKIRAAACGKILYSFVKQSSSEASGLLHQAYVENCMSHTTAHRWYKTYVEDIEEVDDETSSERPSTSRNPRMVKTVSVLVREDRHCHGHCMYPYSSYGNVWAIPNATLHCRA